MIDERDASVTEHEFTELEVVTEAVDDSVKSNPFYLELLDKYEKVKQESIGRRLEIKELKKSPSPTPDTPTIEKLTQDIKNAVMTEIQAKTQQETKQRSEAQAIATEFGVSVESIFDIYQTLGVDRAKTVATAMSKKRFDPPTTGGNGVSTPSAQSLRGKLGLPD